MAPREPPTLKGDMALAHRSKALGLNDSPEPSMRSLMSPGINCSVRGVKFEAEVPEGQSYGPSKNQWP